ncbi:MAG: hypothetical protein V4547_18245 [Bacteroidota bacterium]
MTNINIEQIVSVAEYPKHRNRKYNWKEEYKHWFWKTEPEGFYESWYPADKLHTKEQIEKDGQSYVEDKKVFYKPHAHVTLSNKDYYEKFFTTVEEMKSYVMQLKDQGLKLEQV